MLLIGTLAPVPAQGGMAGDLWIGVFLAILLAIAVALHFATKPRASAARIRRGPTDQPLGTTV